MRAAGGRRFLKGAVGRRGAVTAPAWTRSGRSGRSAAAQEAEPTAQLEAHVSANEPGWILHCCLPSHSCWRSARCPGPAGGPCIACSGPTRPSSPAGASAWASTVGRRASAHRRAARSSCANSIAPASAALPDGVRGPPERVRRRPSPGCLSGAGTGRMSPFVRSCLAWGSPVAVRAAGVRPSLPFRLHASQRSAGTRHLPFPRYRIGDDPPRWRRGEAPPGRPSTQPAGLRCATSLECAAAHRALVGRAGHPRDSAASAGTFPGPWPRPRPSGSPRPEASPSVRSPSPLRSEARASRVRGAVPWTQRFVG